MRYVAAYVLGSIGGKEPSAADIEKILSSVGIESDKTRLEKVVSDLKGKNVEDLITSGHSKLSSIPMGGGGGGVAISAAASAVPAAAAASAETKKEEKPPEKEESESDDDMGFGLFD